MSTEKLKSLKVVDLKQILSNASVHVPAKSNKNDLIAKIQASTAAMDAYNSLYPADDLLVSADDVADWSEVQTEPVAVPAESALAAPAPAPSASIQPSQNPLDDDEEKRRKRAERFGIPFVASEPTKVKPTKGSTLATSEQLQARAARFGLPTTTDKTANSKKRPNTVDAEEEERLKKRAERFGTGS